MHNIGSRMPDTKRGNGLDEEAFRQYLPQTDNKKNALRITENKIIK